MSINEDTFADLWHLWEDLILEDAPEGTTRLPERARELFRFAFYSGGMSAWKLYEAAMAQANIADPASIKRTGDQLARLFNELNAGNKRRKIPREPDA